MKVYLDVSCLNRPFDDQSQVRIRLEAEAVALILERCEQGEWTQVSSGIAEIEIRAIPDIDRQARVQLLLPDKKDILKLTQAIWARAVALEKLGFKAADALHVSAAEELNVDVLLTCDDRLCRRGLRCRRLLSVRIANPLDWLKETGHAANP